MPGYHLGDGMLHLDAGVHLNEVEVPVLVQHKLNGAGTVITGGLCRQYRRLSHLLPEFRGQGTGRGFLDHLLIAALHRAVPLAQMHHMTLLIRQDLELDVLGVEDQLFHIDRAVPEAGLGLCRCGGKGIFQLSGHRPGAFPVRRRRLWP